MIETTLTCCVFTMPFPPDLSSRRLSSFLPPVQGFHIDAGDFAAVHGFDVSEVGVQSFLLYCILKLFYYF